MARRSSKRDSKGRFSRVAGAKGAAKAATRTVGPQSHEESPPVLREGSFEKNLSAGQRGDYKAAKAGAEFRTATGRGLLVEGTVGYHGKPGRRLDATPRLDKPQRELAATVRKNSAGTKVSSEPKAPPRSASSGTKVRR